ncbi:Glycosyl transferases group 1 [uncultured Caudovirales phage]|uniref:Glycosyl transferases group 1 n=1 Tax=uncultured Caudovirales phage TaxID=2100421 RepID=A0A6J5QKQ8_9CAUD|nr:Glycosyl transferases group 1 [uncultured Caudovirales phage]CAB4181528.1 Glycosyl transferases group 1 [uncultured Caudovirales phage]CAB4198747.1 Glycosyl transferases group 1 [uncultured Caudovirales phage]CAB4210543.1 Glycosyl transferases group 1 [uncultured Caudovirales phage]CAB5227119.1 Glycosyl transferases group 1 [uncultured Caudovirales phage]
MKILTIGNFGTGWDGSICDEEHIAKALEWQGHEVTRCQRGGVSFNNGNNDYDFTLIAQWDGYTEESLKYLPKPLVYWAFDYQADGQEWHERLIASSDLYLSKRIADSKYPNWQWFSQDFSPMFLNRHDQKPERDIDVLFTGSYLPWATERNETLKAVDNAFNLVIHSITPDAWIEQGFKNVFGPVMDHDLSALIARAKINISIDHMIEAGYWSDRNAQIMACGGLVLFRYIPLSEQVFKDKVVYFHNIPDCLEKIDWLLSDWGYRKMFGSQGYTFAQNNLLVSNKVKDLITIVGGIL